MERRTDDFHICYGTEIIINRHFEICFFSIDLGSIDNNTLRGDHCLERKAPERLVGGREKFRLT